jgi:protein-tyrosine phosphatase
MSAPTSNLPVFEAPPPSLRLSVAVGGKHALASCALPRTVADVRALASVRIGCVVTLTASPAPFDAALVESAHYSYVPLRSGASKGEAKAGKVSGALSLLKSRSSPALVHFHFPLAASELPSPDHIDSIIRVLNEFLRTPPDATRSGVAFACEDGLGPSCILAACVLIARGTARDANHALLIMRREREGACPTSAHEEAIKRWCAVRDRNFSFVLQAPARQTSAYESGSQTLGSRSTAPSGVHSTFRNIKVAGMMQPGKIRRLSSDLDFLKQNGIRAIVTVSEDALDARDIAEKGYGLVPMTPLERAALSASMGRDLDAAAAHDNTPDDSGEDASNAVGLPMDDSPTAPPPVATAAVAPAPSPLPSATAHSLINGVSGSDFRYLFLPIPIYHAPTMDQINRFLEFLDICDKERRDVAVHCAAGQGRTGTLLACALISRDGLTADQAIAEVRRLRPGSIESPEQELAIYEHYKRLQPAVQPTPSSTQAAARLEEPPSKGNCVIV